MSRNKNISISVHKTLNGQLQVDWDLDYHQEYNCPHCNQSKLTRFYYYKQYKCQLVLYCNRCQKHTYLTCVLRRMGLKNNPIYKHQTLKKNLKINWLIEYNNEYNCPHCNQSKLTRFYYHKTLKCNLTLQCNKCQKYTYLTCSIPVHISRYRPKIECPNSTCNLVGHDGQKGWIYKYSDEHYKCYFCKICFNVDFTKKNFWSTSLEEQLPPFSFGEDTWNLKYFYDESTLVSKTLNFHAIQPNWYKQRVKKYIFYLLIEKENILDANGQKPHFTGKITRSSRLQEVRTKHGMEAAQLYADHKKSATTFQHYAPPTREQVAEVDLPFQELLLNPDNKFLPWQSLPESLLKNPKAHELDLEIAPRLVVYGHCALNPKTPCPVNLFPKCYGCSSFRPSTGKLPLYERQYQGEQQRLTEAEKVGAELASEEAKATIEAMDKWLPELRRLANG